MRFGSSLEIGRRSHMRKASLACCLSQLILALLPACGDSAVKRDADARDGGVDGVAPGRSDAANLEFTVAGCQADTCGAEAVICGWTASDAKYLGCLADCQMLGTVGGKCPAQATALYACASLGAKVDCTTGKGTGCDTEEQALTGCFLTDGGP
jgi:hypothetical protein